MQVNVIMEINQGYVYYAKLTLALLEYTKPSEQIKKIINIIIIIKLCEQVPNK